MNPAIVTAIIVTLGSTVVGYLTVRQTRQGNKATVELAKSAVSREDFKEVMDRMEADLERTDKRAAKAEERIAVVEKKLQEEIEGRESAERRATQAEARSAAAERRASTAERVVLNLEKRVRQLETILEDNHITVPPIAPD